MPLDPAHLAESASVRFDDVLHRINSCLPVFGVIRSDLLSTKPGWNAVTTVPTRCCWRNSHFSTESSFLDLTII